MIGARAIKLELVHQAESAIEASRSRSGMLVAMPVVAWVLMAFIGGHEELFAGTGQPELYHRLSGHAFGVGARDGGSLFYQVIHRAVADSAAQHEIHPAYGPSQSTTTAARLNDALSG